VRHHGRLARQLRAGVERAPGLERRAAASDEEQNGVPEESQRRNALLKKEESSRSSSSVQINAAQNWKLKP
jgi:hypothetical protein